MSSEIVLTYANQPNNVGAWSIGEACSKAKPGGDYIDHGLSLLKELQDRGYGIVPITDERRRALDPFTPPSSATPGDGYYLCEREHVDNPTRPLIELERGMEMDGKVIFTRKDQPQERAGSDAGVVVSDVIWRIDNEAAQFVDEKGMVYLRYLRDRLATPPSSATPGDEKRSTHHVHRGPESLPCYCEAATDHPIGQERAGSDAGAVGTLTVSKFRGHLENTLLDYYGDLPEGSHTLYTRPQPASDASGDSPRDVSWWVRRLKEQEAITDELSRALAESRADGERYRWLRDLKCCTFTLTRDEGHAVNYMTFNDWAEESAEWYANVPAEELERMKATNTDWCLQVYPDTPIGFYTFHGATLDAAIDAFVAAQQQEGQDNV